MDLTTDDAKHAARALRAALAEDGVDVGHGRALELVARQLGFRDWNTASASLRRTPPSPGSRSRPALGAPVPVLRVQDWAVAEPFYRDQLGFAVAWVHRFEPGLPAYARLHRDDAELDLSEHHGDGTPGSVVWVPVRDVHALREELHARPELRQRPGVEADAPGGPTLTVLDPFGNSLRFCEPAG